MLRRIEDGAAAPDVALLLDGRPLAARPGDSVAAALLAAGIPVFRSAPASGAPRGPYCLMGACFECLVEIDGVPGRQACLVEVRDGMTVRREAPAASADGA